MDWKSINQVVCSSVDCSCWCLSMIYKEATSFIYLFLSPPPLSLFLASAFFYCFVPDVLLSSSSWSSRAFTSPLSPSSSSCFFFWLETKSRKRDESEVRVRTNQNFDPELVVEELGEDLNRAVHTHTDTNTNEGAGGSDTPVELNKSISYIPSSIKKVSPNTSLQQSLYFYVRVDRSSCLSSSISTQAPKHLSRTEGEKKTTRKMSGIAFLYTFPSVLWFPIDVIWNPPNPRKRRQKLLC